MFKYGAYVYCTHTSLWKKTLQSKLRLRLQLRLRPGVQQGSSRLHRRARTDAADHRNNRLIIN